MNGIDIRFYESGLRNVLRNSNKNNSKFNIEIKHKKNKNNSNIIDFQIGPHMENRKTYSSNYCILFSININDKKLYNVDLRKCSLLSGREILFILEKIAKIFRLSKIYLEDESVISIISKTNKTYKISLKNMYILSTGISLYNKFEYVSENFREEQEYNTIIMKIPLSDYMSIILKKNLDDIQNVLDRSFERHKKIYFMNILNPVQTRKINEIKSIIKNKYHINNNKLNNPTFITDDILFEGIKIFISYDEKKETIIKNNEKFMTYLESPNLLNYIKLASTISDVIISFRARIKRRNIRLDDNELEFIEYIIDSSHNILHYDSNLVKTITTNL